MVAAALASAFGSCGGGTNRATGLDASANLGSIASDGGTSPCDHYFAALYARCGGPTPPVAEIARIRARFERVCENQFALPGSGVTAASLDACAAALDASPCELPEGLPVACDFRGSLSAGAPCMDSIQCESGQCAGTASYTPVGQATPFTCGTCDPLLMMGDVCVRGGFCPPGSICMTTDTTAKVPNYTCTPISYGDVGAVCDDLAAKCQLGVYCDAQTGRCAKLGGAGASCGETPPPPGNPGGCIAPLSCTGISGTPTCSSGGGAGALCLYDSDCSPELGCIAGPCFNTVARAGCAASGTCGLVSWVGPHQTCDNSSRRCLVGQCSFGNLLNAPFPIDGGLSTGTCPTVIADGQPCTVRDQRATCDTFSECFQGTCTLLDGFDCQ